MQPEFDFYTCYCLIDITCTGVIRSYPDPTSIMLRNKQRNWETIIQVLSLRAQPVYLTEPVIIHGNHADYDFGAEYSGNLSIWTFTFAAEHDGVYTAEVLESDLNRVPCIVGLSEEISLMVPIFSTVLDYRNVYFVRGQYC